jgi:hypothetical protein
MPESMSTIMLRSYPESFMNYLSCKTLYICIGCGKDTKNIDRTCDGCRPKELVCVNNSDRKQLRKQDKPDVPSGMTDEEVEKEREKTLFRLRHRLFFGGLNPRPEGFKTDHEAILSCMLRTNK